MKRWAAVLLVAVACEAPAPSATVEMLASPAGPGSGEPFLAAGADGPLMSWLEPQADSSVALRFAGWDGAAWGAPRTIAARRDYFVNWADFPSILVLPDGGLAAHWLQREGGGTYAYGVRIVRSTDGGATWTEPVTPHTDGVLAEHGFVTLFPDDGALGAVWLDGRNMTGEHGAGDMTIRSARLTEDGLAMEAEIDARTCECCQTDVALTSEGPAVVYRDRSPEELRNITVSRRVDGAWTEPAPVHDDGWVRDGCPVNGPAIVAAGRAAAVAWFTAPGDVPQVNVAFSEDAAASFGAPVRVDEGAPIGRVDLLHLPDGSVLVSWLERTGTGAAVLARRVESEGSAGPVIRVTETTESRAGGFPRMILDGDAVLFAWTDPDAGVRVARLSGLL